MLVLLEHNNTNQSIKRKAARCLHLESLNQRLEFTNIRSGPTIRDADWPSLQANDDNFNNDLKEWMWKILQNENFRRFYINGCVEVTVYILSASCTLQRKYDKLWIKVKRFPYSNLFYHYSDGRGILFMIGFGLRVTFWNSKSNFDMAFGRIPWSRGLRQL